MVGKLLAQVSLGVKLVLEVVVVRLDMVVIAAVAVFKLVESVSVGIKLIESVFVGIKLVLEAMVVRLDMVVIAAVAMSV